MLYSDSVFKGSSLFTASWIDGEIWLMLFGFKRKTEKRKKITWMARKHRAKLGGLSRNSQIQT